METGKQTASMTTWERIPATEQVEIITRAAKRAVYIAGAYGVVLTVDEIMGQTWENTIKRLDAGRLSKANAKRTTEGKTPLTVMQIANRAAHAAVELWRYDYNKHGNVAPLEAWTAIDGGDMEDRIIDRLTVEGFISQRDERDKAIAQLTIIGCTERQTGKAVGISNVAVHKRLARMRKDLRESIA